MKAEILKKLQQLTPVEAEPKKHFVSDCPEHTHLFLEANYLLPGQETEIVAGKDLALKAGDLLLLDVGMPHAIQDFGKDDLLINLIFSKTANFSFAQLIPGRKA